MKRRTFVAGVAGTAGLALSAAACGSGAATKPQETIDTTPVQLSFADWEFLEPGKGDTLWNAIKDYKGPNGNVTLVKVTDPQASYNDKIATQLGAKGGPDVMCLQDGQFATLASAGALVSLKDIADEYGNKLNNTNAFGVVGGTQYGFNWEQTDYCLMYNKDVLAKAGVAVPTTFPELLAAAKTIHTKLGIYGFAGRQSVAELDGWISEIANWLYGFGGGLSTDGKLTINSEANIAAIEHYLELFHSPGVVPIGDGASAFRAKFAQNQVAFLDDNSGIASIMVADPKNLVNSTNLVTAPLAFPNPGVHLLVLMAVNANSAHQAAAKDFVRWLLSTAGQTAMRKGLSAMTLATDTPPDPEFLKNNPWVQTFLDSGKKSHSGVVPGFEKDSRAIYLEFCTAVEGMLRGDDVTTSLTAVQDKAVKEFG
jgi:multiple sugar transport system substrate-binding protein